MFFSIATRPTQAAMRPGQIEKILGLGLEHLGIDAAPPGGEIAESARRPDRGAACGVDTMQRVPAEWNQRSAQ